MAQRILIIEDHDDGRELLTDFLEYSGYTVLQAADGEAGEEKARREIPHLILLDVSLPLKSGWEVARSLQADPQTRSIPIIALTAHVRLEDEEMARQVGCSAFVPKPVKPKEILQEIHRLLQTAPRA